MLSKDDSQKTLRKLFSRHLIADLNMLYQTLDTHSRMSVFRRLQTLGYLSSYTNAGRYYTLTDIPEFDNNGLWFHQEVGFSKFITLKNTAIETVNASSDGMTHSELQNLLRVRIQDTLLNLVRTKQIQRLKIQGLYLYASIDSNQADKQLFQRRSLAQAREPLPTATVIEILVEVIHASGRYVESAIVAARLMSRGVSVSTEQVEGVFNRYGMDTEKKMMESASKLSLD